MYARVAITTDDRKDALLVPTNAVVDIGGRRGVFLAADNNTVTFRPVRVGIEENERMEILDGLAEGDRVVTTGAAALRDGDPIVPAGQGGRGGRASRGGITAAGEGGTRREGAVTSAGGAAADRRSTGRADAGQSLRPGSTGVASSAETPFASGGRQGRRGTGGEGRAGRRGGGATAP
jgi:multidrug efflux system membrane fusion protein